jgi:hypothetical protein
MRRLQLPAGMEAVAEGGEVCAGAPGALFFVEKAQRKSRRSEDRFRDEEDDLEGHCPRLFIIAASPLSPHIPSPPSYTSSNRTRRRFRRFSFFSSLIL